jgi:hypothetical protein
MADTQYLAPLALAKVRSLELQARLIVESFPSGMHKSPCHGFSGEFAEHREYVPGDDLKHLDRKVYSLLNRKRFHVVEWAAMRFLPAGGGRMPAACGWARRKDFNFAGSPDRYNGARDLCWDRRRPWWASSTHPTVRPCNGSTWKKPRCPARFGLKKGPAPLGDPIKVLAAATPSP